jgi:hypothetical protein
MSGQRIVASDFGVNAFLIIVAMPQLFDEKLDDLLLLFRIECDRLVGNYRKMRVCW